MSTTNAHDRAALVRLWVAANDHSVCMIGAWLPIDYDGDDIPPAPSNAEIIAQVTRYLDAFK